MAMTRRVTDNGTTNMNIHEDADDASCGSKSDHDVETALLNALRPLGDASSKQNLQLAPTTSSRPGTSPTKASSSPSRPRSAHSLKDSRFPLPPTNSFPMDSPRKKADFYALYDNAAAMTEKSLFGHFTTAHSYEKENVYDYNAFPAMPYSDTDYGYKGPMKRTSTHDTGRSSGKKQKVESEEPIDLPDPRDMPLVTDDGTKPLQSYAELIGMAILRSPNRRLTLAQIYKWISDHFAFYKPAEAGWQNSIRHNLSLNKNFIKQERPKDDPGKGNYWAIKPGEERPYLLGKKSNPLRRITNPDGSQYGLPELPGLPGLPQGAWDRPSTAPAISHFTLAPSSHSTGSSAMKKAVVDSAKFPDVENDILSSDGTIPGSDPALQEDNDNVDDGEDAMPPPATLTHFRSSPPPTSALGSSPPPRSTPPPPERLRRHTLNPSSSVKVNDSGYFSSLDLLTSDPSSQRPVRQNLKRGRAELEIARIRGSSSPVRDPLTPAVVFKRPSTVAKALEAASPGANLRNHRSRMRALLGGSPLKSGEASPMVWGSPAFSLAEGPVGLTPSFSSPAKSGARWGKGFDVFVDAPLLPAVAEEEEDEDEDLTARGSPEKRIPGLRQRPSLARAATTILADVTGAAGNRAVTFSPLRSYNKLGGGVRSPTKGVGRTTGLGLGSPLKQRYDVPSASFADEDDFSAPQNFQLLHSDGSGTGSEEGIDLFQDFGKIGQLQRAPVSSMQGSVGEAGSPRKRGEMMPPPPPRPGLGRSMSSRW